MREVESLIEESKKVVDTDEEGDEDLSDDQINQHSDLTGGN